MMKSLRISSFIFAGLLYLSACGQANEMESPTVSSFLSDDELLLEITPESITDIIPASESAVTLVNVWATWCAPCIKEFPYLVQLQKAYPEDLVVVFISADFPEDKPRAIEFLREQGVDQPSFLKTGKDLPFIAAISDNWSGSIPFTQLYLPDGTIVAEWSGEADLERFEELFLLARDKMVSSEIEIHAN